MTAVFWAAFAALWVIVIFQTLVLLGLTRTISAAPVEAHAPDDAADTLQGQPAPSFTAIDVRGDHLSSADFVGRPVALLFVSPDCEHCSVTLNELEALESKVGGAVVVMCRSERSRCAQLAETYGLRVPVVADEDFSLSRLFRVAGAPTAVLLSAEGVVESYGRPMGASDLEQSMQAAGWPATATGSVPVSEAVDTGTIHVDEWRGSRAG